MMPMRPLLLAQPARQREAILAGQSDIEQHELRQLALDQLAQRGAVLGAADAEILPGEIIDQQLALRRLVLDHDDMRTVVHPCEPCRDRGGSSQG